LLVIRGITCVAEQLLFCGKQRGVPAQIFFVKLFYSPTKAQVIGLKRVLKFTLK